MTGPVPTEALTEALAYLKPHETNGGTISLKAPKAREAVAVIEAALQQVMAERDEARARADRIDAKLGELNAAVRECLPPVDTLIAERQAAEASLATATSELARLRAEGEALRAALNVFADMDAMNPPKGVSLNEWLPAVTGARAALREPPALARAATAREGQADG